MVVRRILKETLRRGAALAGPHRWPSQRPRLWVLMYHRILPNDDPRTTSEEPGMVVTPETLRRHLEWLASSFEIVHLVDWIDRARSGRTLPPRACAITFDDGWRDNFQFAFPILREASTPATVFAVSHMIGTQESFWPNRLANLLRDPRLRESGTTLAQRLPSFVALPKDRPPIGAELSTIISEAKSLTEMEILGLVTEAEVLLGSEQSPERSLMNWEELTTMIGSGLVDVGSHTCHHTRLTNSTPVETTCREILESKRLLEDRLGRPVRLFCYPNGDVSKKGHDLVREHYDAAVTTRRFINTLATPRFGLGRIGLHEDISRQETAFFARLSGWL